MDDITLTGNLASLGLRDAGTTVPLDTYISLENRASGVNAENLCNTGDLSAFCLQLSLFFDQAHRNLSQRNGSKPSTDFTFLLHNLRDAFDAKRKSLSLMRNVLNDLDMNNRRDAEELAPEISDLIDCVQTFAVLHKNAVRLLNSFANTTTKCGL